MILISRFGDEDRPSSLKQPGCVVINEEIIETSSKETATSQREAHSDGPDERWMNVEPGCDHGHVRLNYF
ncbi:MAG: hypothetical protein J0L73_21970 [Verrucomicrobia bacterium]|nr:hypothetical protein [Verrucomicrobiota bacterium]